MGALLGLGIGILFLVFAVVIALYIVMGIYLNKLNEIEFGKKTCFAWIPVLNFYLLGKLAINKFFGWVMALGLFLMGTSSVTVNDVTTTTSFLPEPFNTIYTCIYGVALIAFLIVVIVKYNKKKYI